MGKGVLLPTGLHCLVLTQMGKTLCILPANHPGPPLMHWQGVLTYWAKGPPAQTPFVNRRSFTMSDLLGAEPEFLASL